MASDALVTTQLTRRFGARVAISSLNLSVEEGCVYGFLGPNGAGKTTAIRCILSLLEPDEGTVSIFGETHPVRRRQHVGAMVETPAFHGWLSGLDNLKRAIAFAGQGDQRDIDRVLEWVGLNGREKERVQGYSLGMRQRLGIARALVSRPRLLILDEPTNGLDPRGMKEVRDLLQKLAMEQDMTIFISSHLLNEVELLCSRVGIIDQGRMITEGTVPELLARLPSSDVMVGSNDTDALRSALTKMAGVTLVDNPGSPLLRVQIKMDAASLNQNLVNAGISLHSLIPKSGSLEDLFLSLTSEDLS